MAAEAKQKGEAKAKPNAEVKEKKEKKEKKAKAPAEAEVPADAEPKAPPPPSLPRTPSDPRLKILERFRGTFLPKGVLRDRHKALMTRWNSGDDHGGVRIDELKALLDDWKGTREKPPRLPRG